MGKGILHPITVHLSLIPAIHWCESHFLMRYNTNRKEVVCAFVLFC